MQQSRTADVCPRSVDQTEDEATTATLALAKEISGETAVFEQSGLVHPRTRERTHRIAGLLKRTLDGVVARLDALESRDRAEGAADRFLEALKDLQPQAPRHEPTKEEVEAWGREFEAAAVRLPAAPTEDELYAFAQELALEGDFFGRRVVQSLAREERLSTKDLAMLLEIKEKREAAARRRAEGGPRCLVAIGEAATACGRKLGSTVTGRSWSADKLPNGSLLRWSTDVDRVTCEMCAGSNAFLAALGTTPEAPALAAEKRPRCPCSSCVSCPCETSPELDSNAMCAHCGGRPYSTALLGENGPPHVTWVTGGLSIASVRSIATIIAEETERARPRHRALDGRFTTLCGLYVDVRPGLINGDCEGILWTTDALAVTCEACDAAQLGDIDAPEDKSIGLTLTAAGQAEASPVRALPALPRLYLDRGARQEAMDLARAVLLDGTASEREQQIAAGLIAERGEMERLGSGVAHVERYCAKLLGGAS